jgi:hypothetical protein
MSLWNEARRVPSSSVVGGSVSLHDETGRVIGQVMVLNIIDRSWEDYNKLVDAVHQALRNAAILPTDPREKATELVRRQFHPASVPKSIEFTCTCGVTTYIVDQREGKRS